jgi:hypothetical protein
VQNLCEFKFILSHEDAFLATKYDVELALVAARSGLDGRLGRPQPAGEPGCKCAEGRRRAGVGDSEECAGMVCRLSQSAPPLHPASD